MNYDIINNMSNVNTGDTFSLTPILIVVGVAVLALIIMSIISKNKK